MKLKEAGVRRLLSKQFQCSRGICCLEKIDLLVKFYSFE
jgi:hypothetical protein